MISRRVIYIIALTGSFFLYVLSPFWFPLYLFVILLSLAPFDFLISLPGMLTRHAILSAPDLLEQGFDGTLILTTLQRNSYPVRCIKANLQISCNGSIYRKRLYCKAKHKSKCEISIDTSRSGVIIYELKKIRTVSLAGLFTIPVKVNRKVSVLVLPKPVKPPHVAALPRGVVFRPKPGGGFAEDYDLKPYRKGDPVRSIHWKLSAKLNSLIIREPLVPPPHSRLVRAAQWNNDRERDLVLGRLRWISNYLLKWDLPFFLILGDNAPVVEISEPADLLSYIRNVLEGIPPLIPVSGIKPTRFTWIFRLDGKEGEPD